MEISDIGYEIMDMEEIDNSFGYIIMDMGMEMFDNDFGYIGDNWELEINYKIND